MAKKNKNEILKDEAEGFSEASLTFAKFHKKALSLATTLEAKFKADGEGDWNEYNVRFYNPLGQEFWFSGLNCGYKGSGPQALVKVLKLIKWKVNPDLVFINEELQIAREVPVKLDGEEESE